MIKNLKSLFSPEQITAIFSGLNPSKKGKKAESQYGNMLRESRKIRLFYGNLSKKYLQKLFREKTYFPCQRNQAIFTILESRLDVVLYRSGFFESIAAAKQAILTGIIEINKKKGISPGSRVVPGDVVQILKSSKTNSVFLPYFSQKNARLKQYTGAIGHTSSNDRTKGDAFAETEQFKKFTGDFHFGINHQLKKKQTEWRFQASPFLLALLKNQKKIGAKQITKTSEFRLKWIENTFYKSKTILFSKAYWNWWCPQPLFSPKAVQSKPLVNTVKKRFSDFKNNSSSQPLNLRKEFDKKQSQHYFEIKKDNCYQNEIQKKEKSNFVQPLIPEQLNEISNWLFSNYLMFLKKQFVSLSIVHTFLTSVKNLSTRKPFFPKQEGENRFNGRLSSTRVKLEEKKVACFSKQKNQLFFKEQPFFESKKVKPLHLEISYKSKYIIFLFPPQRVSLPAFINVSQIYK